MNLCTRFGLVFVLIFTFSMSVGAQSISLLLERGIYTEETLGNIAEAITIYQQIVADLNTARPTAALALFRLGICYQKSGQKSRAQNTFGRLAKSYPEQHDLIAKIPASSNTLQLKAAPWVDGEILRTVTSDNKGMVLMKNEYRVASVRESGQSAWHMQKYSIGMGGTFQSARVQVDARTNTPIRSRIINRAPRTNYAYQAEYAPDHIDYSTVVNGAPGKSRRLAVDSIVYDYEALLQLIRCLPLALDFDFTAPTLITAIGSVFDEKIKVGRPRSRHRAGGNLRLLQDSHLGP